ncbi:MAG: T9SS type A sorting domain-containing protein [Sphingobacteriales bacterium]|nr:T9SS type A sorting domain-containing protein [Sphingobacteriales bacterium]
MMKRLALLMLSCTWIYTVTAQQRNYWSPHPAADRVTTDKAVARLSFPLTFRLFDLAPGQLRQDLFTVLGNTSRHAAVISLPNAEGQLEDFEVFEASNFEPDLQARFPEIRAFSGRGITDPSATLKLSYSPQGIQTMVFRTEKENEFMEPYSADHQVYAVFKSQRTRGSLPWTCSTVDRQLATGLHTGLLNTGLTARSGGDLKTMRLAQSVTAEYSNYFGATGAAQVNLVLAGINATLTRCNGVYEKDLAVHLNLISASTNVIYYNASTDPYSPASSGTGGAWNTELQNTLTSVIGDANYDIGHLFGATGGGGNAGCIGCICTNGSKGSGYTSPADGIPQGDNFDIDYVVHEMGHQMGANHTFSMSNEGTGVNKEPGSGITIMGYAGITSQDLAPHSFDFYHQASIAQIQANLGTKTCPVTTSVAANNATPVVSAGGNFTIPISTPFALTGSATDANAGDVLTYCWEQNDNASSTQTGASSVASATKATGPNWISFRPVTSPTRYFPKMETILAGGLVSGPLTGGDAGANTEALSSVSRTLNFRLTVRDNAVYRSTAPVSVGQTSFADRVITVSNTSGPFQVTAPNTAVSWAGNSSQTITWSVANTTAAPVSCANVKISISTDGGTTFSTLVASTPNDGTEAVTIPNTPSTTARIKIEAVGNIFFDISNTNFTITSGAGCGAPAGLTASSITTTGATVSWTAVSGALSYDVDYKLNTSATWTNAATGTTAVSVALSGLTSGSLYDWRVRTNCSGSSSGYTQAQFTTQSTVTCNAPAGLTSSAVTASSATVGWTAVTGAVSYDVDYKLNTAGTWTNAATGTTAVSVAISGLTASSLYDWRVRTNCSGGSSGYTQAQFTTAATSGCGTAFEPNETQATAATIAAGVTNSAAITTSTDIDYFKVVTTATSSNTFNLVGPTGVDFDMTIYNSAGTQIGSGISSTATETVSLTNQAAGTYYIKVFGYNGANSATCYTIKATVTTATACASSLDNSTNGTVSGAATIPFNTDVKGLINSSTDVDYYKFVVTTGGTATITLTTLPADYDVKLYSSNGTTQLAVSQNGGTSSETISRTYTAGTYYIRVYGYNGANNASSCYTLRVALGTATREVPAEFTSTDKISVFPNPVVSGSLTVNLPGIKGQADLRLFDVFGKMVVRQTASSVNTQLEMSKLPAGIYLLKVLNNGKEQSLKVVKE